MKIDLDRAAALRRRLLDGVRLTDAEVAEVAGFLKCLYTLAISRATSGVAEGEPRFRVRRVEGQRAWVEIGLCRGAATLMTWAPEEGIGPDDVMRIEPALLRVPIKCVGG